jgi:filamentous hemagglutinin
LEQSGWEITGGGGRAKETFLPGKGPGTKGGNFTDITATKDGEILHVNTVSTLKDGVTPTANEARAAAAIRAKLGPNERLILVPKKP